jgi:hypothetical protein
VQVAARTLLTGLLPRHRGLARLVVRLHHVGAVEADLALRPVPTLAAPTTLAAATAFAAVAAVAALAAGRPFVSRHRVEALIRHLEARRLDDIAVHLVLARGAGAIAAPATTSPATTAAARALPVGPGLARAVLAGRPRRARRGLARLVAGLLVPSSAASPVATRFGARLGAVPTPAAYTAGLTTIVAAGLATTFATAAAALVAPTAATPAPTPARRTVGRQVVRAVVVIAPPVPAAAAAAAARAPLADQHLGLPRAQKSHQPRTGLLQNLDVDFVPPQAELQQRFGHRQIDGLALGFD